MEKKPEVRLRERRVYFYGDLVVQLGITGLFHSTKNDINSSLSVNCRSGQHRCASVCWQAPLFIYGEEGEDYSEEKQSRCRSPPSILIFGSIKKSKSEDYHERNKSAGILPGNI